MAVIFVLGAMGADYYPSLTAVNHDHAKMRDLVNQQTEVGILLALPGLLATLAMAPWVIRIFYTAEFAQAADLLQWYALGCMGQVVSWPLGFIILAKGAARLFAGVETGVRLLHLILTAVLLVGMGIEGVSVAFFFLYIIYTLSLLFLTHRMIGFSWSRGVLKLLVVMCPAMITGFLVVRFLSPLIATISGLLLTTVVSIFCLRGLLVRLGPEHKVCRLALKVPLLRFLVSRGVFNGSKC
jgi:PST family polysaccharide transporter